MMESGDIAVENMNMGIRTLRGDPITNRGPHPLPCFETVITMKEGARNVFPPIVLHTRTTQIGSTLSSRLG